MYTYRFRNLTVGNELGAAKHLRGKVSFILAVSPYVVRGDQNNNIVDYDVLGSNYVKNLPSLLGEVIKLGAHKNLNFFTLYLTFR